MFIIKNNNVYFLISYTSISIVYNFHFYIKNKSLRKKIFWKKKFLKKIFGTFYIFIHIKYNLCDILNYIWNIFK